MHWCKVKVSSFAFALLLILADVPAVSRDELAESWKEIKNETKVQIASPVLIICSPLYGALCGIKTLPL